MFNANPNVIGQLVKLGMQGEQGRRLIQSYYYNPPEWMSPTEAKLYVPIAAERLDQLRKDAIKAAAPQTTVAEDKVAGLAGLQPQQAAPQQQPQQAQQAPTQQPQAQSQETPAGGVADLPIPDDMYQEQSMAGGGIVAFDGGGEVQRFANRGLVSLNTPQLNSNLQFLLQQYAALPDDSPQKAQVAAAIQQIENQMNPGESSRSDTGLSSLAGFAAPQVPGVLGGNAGIPAAAQTSSIYSKVPVLDQSDKSINEARSGIAGIMKNMEYTPAQIESMGKQYMTEREGAGAPFRTKAEELLAKQQTRADEIGKNADLKTALKFFTSLAGSKSPYFATAAGMAGSEAIDYRDKIEENIQRAQAAADSANMNYQMARAAEAKGDFDARDKFINAAKDDRRSAASAQIKGYQAQGELAAAQAKSYLDLRKTQIDEVRARAEVFRAQNPESVLMYNTIEGKVRTLNKAGAYNDVNGGKPLSEAQIQSVAAGTFVDFRHGNQNVDKDNTIRVKAGENVMYNINTVIAGQDPRYNQIRTKQTELGKLKEGSPEYNALAKQISTLKDTLTQEEASRMKTSTASGQSGMALPSLARMPGFGTGVGMSDFTWDPTADGGRGAMVPAGQ